MSVLVTAVRKSLLWVVTTLVPVVMAACYGVMYGFRRSGRVVDAESGNGIKGIKVSALDAQGRVVGTATTTADSFFLCGDETPAKYVFTDVDGEANGGDFGETTLPAGEVESGKPVRLQKRR